LLVLDGGRGELVAPAGLVDLARVDRYGRRRVAEAPHARAGELGGEAQAQRPAVVRGLGQVEPHGDQLGRDRVGRGPVGERRDGHLEVEPATLAGGQLEPGEVERVRPRGHPVTVAAMNPSTRTPAQLYALVVGVSLFAAGI